MVLREKPTGTGNRRRANRSSEAASQEETSAVRQLIPWKAAVNAILVREMFSLNKACLHRRLSPKLRILFQATNAARPHSKTLNRPNFDPI
jgi:hypothetical protein